MTLPDTYISHHRFETESRPLVSPDQLQRLSLLEEVIALVDPDQSALSTLLSSTDPEHFSQGLELAHALFGEELLRLCLSRTHTDQSGFVALDTPQTIRSRERSAHAAGDYQLALWSLWISGALDHRAVLGFRQNMVTDLSWFGDLEQLAELTLDRCYALSSVAFMHRLPNLQRLHLRYPVGSVDHVNHLPPIQELYVRMPVNDCTYQWNDNMDLQRLSITITPTEIGVESPATTLSDLTLGHMPHLTELSLSHECIEHNWRRYGYTPTIDDLPALRRLKISRAHEILCLTFSSLICAPDQLTHLSLQSCKNLRSVWGFGLTGLTHLEITGCASLTTLDLTECHALTHLDLSNCTALESVEGLDELIERGTLRALRLSGCARLTSLSSLESCLRLEELDLGMLSLLNLNEFPPLSRLRRLTCGGGRLKGGLDLTKARQLKAFRLRGGHHLTELRGLDLLNHLTELEVRDCARLTQTPEATSTFFAQLSALTELTALHLDHVGHLTSLEPLSALTNLRAFTLSECDALNHIGALSAWPRLAHLDLSWCGRITSLEPITQLAELETLNLSGCRQIVNWTRVGSLRNLRSLALSHTGVRAVHLTGMPYLKRLSFNRCDQLATLDLSELPELQTLELKGLTSLEDVDLSNLPRLQELHLTSPHLHTLRLKRLPLLRRLESDLRDLGVLECHDLPLISFHTLERFMQADRLRDVTIVNLSFLQVLSAHLPSLERLSLSHVPALISLDLSGCERLRTLIEISEAPILNSVDLHGCINLSELPSLNTCKAITELNLSGCHRLERLPELAPLSAMTHLNLSGCHQLKRLPELSSLSALTNLDLSECYLLNRLPDVKGLTALERLNLSACNRLAEAPDLSPLCALTHLDLSRCDWVSDLTWMEPLCHIEHLRLRECAQLRDIFGIKKLTALRSLDLSRYPPEVMGVIELRALSQLEQLWPSSLWRLVPRLDSDLTPRIFTDMYSQAR